MALAKPILINNSNSCLLDLSNKGPNVHLHPNQRDVFQRVLQQLTKDKIGIGGYLEERNLYRRSSAFNDRFIHLGVDVWVPSETKVFAITDGEIHSFNNNQAIGDYGPTLIIKHVINGLEIHCLYGHLSKKSLQGLIVGQKIKKGEQLGTVGTYEENGNWEPHLHFQLIKDMAGYFGDYPGVCSKAELAHQKKNCPNPNLIFNLNCLD